MTAEIPSSPLDEEAALQNQFARDALTRIAAMMDAKDSQIRELESKLLTARQAPAVAPAYPASVAWYEVGSAPTETWLLVAAQFDGPDDWRVKMGHIIDGKWVVLGGSWTPTRWTHMPASPGAASAMFAQEPAMPDVQMVVDGLASLPVSLPPGMSRADAEAMMQTALSDWCLRRGSVTPMKAEGVGNG